MEHIKATLGKSRLPVTILHPQKPDEEPTYEERKEELRRRLNLTSWDNTFRNFRPVKGTEASLAAFKELASGKATWFMLLCYGSDGCGKTHLCEALSIAFALKNIACRVNVWYEIVRDFKRRMHSDFKDDYDVMFENFRKQPWLIIDDVGSGSTGSNWEWGELEEIIDYRYRHCLFTVLTTNLDIEPDPRLGQDKKKSDAPRVPRRIVSRFTDGAKSRLVLNSAGNYRPKKGK